MAEQARREQAEVKRLPSVAHNDCHQLQSIRRIDSIIYAFQIVVQIGGKKKGIIKTKKNVEEKTIMDLISKEDRINKNLKNKKINKVFFVKNRLINILLND